MEISLFEKEKGKSFDLGKADIGTVVRFFNTNFEEELLSDEPSFFIVTGIKNKEGYIGLLPINCSQLFYRPVDFPVYIHKIEIRVKK